MFGWCLMHNVCMPNHVKGATLLGCLALEFRLELGLFDEMFSSASLFATE